MKDFITKKALHFLIVIAGFLFFTGTAHAQLLTNGTEQPNITGQNPFIDVSTNFDPSVSDGKEGKGIVFPRTDLTTWTFKTQLLGTSFPSAYDGMIVYNTGTGTTVAGQGNQVRVEPGFYFFYNPNATTSIASGSWAKLDISEQ